MCFTGVLAITPGQSYLPVELYTPLEELVPYTPANVKQVNQLAQQIKDGNPNPVLLAKLAKACNAALAKITWLESTNKDLVRADQRKKDKANRKKGHWGDGRVVSRETLNEMECNMEFKNCCLRSTGSGMTAAMAAD